MGERTVRTRTSPGPGSGSGRSATSSTSVGSPNVEWMSARMAVLLLESGSRVVPELPPLLGAAS